MDEHKSYLATINATRNATLKPTVSILNAVNNLSKNNNYSYCYITAFKPNSTPIANETGIPRPVAGWLGSAG